MVKLWHEEMTNTKLTEPDCPLGTTHTLHTPTEQHRARQPTNKRRKEKPKPKTPKIMAVCEWPLKPYSFAGHSLPQQNSLNKILQHNHRI